MSKQQSEPLNKEQHRETLKKIIDKELSNLPLLLADLSPKERVEIVCKLLPFVMEKERATVKGIWA